MENDNYQSGEFYYNQSYHYTYHEYLLKDTFVMEFYQKLLGFNPLQIRDKIILDIGSGIGIFSLFAARAGAKHVYSWEPSNLSLYAQDSFKENGFDNLITLFSGPIEDFKIKDKIDLIICSRIGYSFFLESFFPQFIKSRDLFQNSNTLFYPGIINFYISGYSSSNLFQKNNFWGNVYEFDFSPMKNEEIQFVNIDLLSHSRICTDKSLFLFIESDKIKFENFFEGNFSLISNNEIELEGFIIWFDMKFLINNKIETLSTSPFNNDTHWCQTLLPLKNKIKLNQNELILGTLKIEFQNNCKPLLFNLEFLNKNNKIFNKYIIK